MARPSGGPSHGGIAHIPHPAGTVSVFQLSCPARVLLLDTEVAELQLG